VPTSFPSFPILLNPPPRSFIRKAIPSASFCSSKVPFLYQGDNPFSNCLVVVRHVEGMNQSLCNINMWSVASGYTYLVCSLSASFHIETNACKRTGKLLLLRRIGHLEFQC
jgi:hypothetical protein